MTQNPGVASDGPISAQGATELLKAEEVYKKLLDARRAVKLLMSLSVDFLQFEEPLNEEIEKLEKWCRVFITKPFRVHEATGKDLYWLMRSRASAAMHLIEKNRSEAERENK